MPVVLATVETEAGGLLEPSAGQVWTTQRDPVS